VAVGEALISYDEVRRLDEELLRLSRGMAAVRLQVGAGLEALALRGGHHELGFSSLEAYARERCERTGRWAADTRALARRLGKLPALRQALCRGQIGWSVAELVARHVTTDTELEWLERARSMTVRELRAALRGDQGRSESSADEEEACAHLLTTTALREDAWTFECARQVAAQEGGICTAEEYLRALLAEGLLTLIDSVPADRQQELCELSELGERLEGERKAQAAWCAERESWRKEAEALCRCRPAGLVGELEVPEQTLPTAPEELDRELRRLCAELCERDLALGLVAERARRAEVWRRLGFASEEHYARERLGVSLSSLKSKRALAVRAARLPELKSALSSGVIGYEAAYLLSRVATGATVGAWIERARARTIKHLREEVEAAELLIRFGHGPDQRPPDDATMRQFFAIESSIAVGEMPEVARLIEELEPSQMSGGRRTRAERALGRVTYRWHVSADTARFWRTLEHVYLRVSPLLGVRASFLRFLAENFCCTWLPALRRRRLTVSGEEPAYFKVYQRDAFRCTSPVCTRRDVTPHHLVFRAAGGGDDAENLTTLCVWCHLRGVHAGRLSAVPPASRIRWCIGRSATIEVEGRTRLAS
jgi:hypothetical protein